MPDPDRTLVIQINLAEREIRQRVEEVVDYLRERNQLGDIERALSEGRYEDAIREVERAAAMVAETTALAYVSSGQATAGVIEMLAPGGHSVTFEVTNERAVSYLRRSRFDLIRGFTQTQIETTRAVLLDGQAQGLNPRVQARALRDAIGLTDYQYQIVANYRRALETGDVGDALARELRDRRGDRRIARMREQPLTQKEIDARVDAYRRRWIAFRAETIARTEALRAVHAGADESWLQAVEDGDIDPALIECEWNIAGGVNRRGRRRTRDSHWYMRDQVQPFGTPFISGHGNLLRYPCDPDASASETVNCRCRKVTRLRAMAA